MTTPKSYRQVGPPSGTAGRGPSRPVRASNKGRRMKVEGGKTEIVRPFLFFLLPSLWTPSPAGYAHPTGWLGPSAAFLPGDSSYGRCRRTELALVDAPLVRRQWSAAVAPAVAGRPGDVVCCAAQECLWYLSWSGMAAEIRPARIRPSNFWPRRRCSDLEPSSSRPSPGLRQQSHGPRRRSRGRGIAEAR